ncbi:chromodomain helicase DNA binding protein family [Acanthamoeba castellanii str. Neff]|uniref:Chromodomain helicase DNA binding protein family n=1 Tax=Acanthamoeba castellanii (strain ATCC 30010 / Neff) TaxID=1257118 RepID=L8GJE7_ACACF|nr:chromodomain helicase DNA binding protein family [Acanthamoeba castellanii str. Neff]ELR12316.1 chromodomain helicase DNA binding protein family [Acanthamoeba castellanii str. Neff]
MSDIGTPDGEHHQSHQGEEPKTKLSHQSGSLDGEDEDKPFNPDLAQVDRILGVKEELDDDGNAVTKYLVKWESKPHNESTWELATDINDDEKVAQFKRINQLPPASNGPLERPAAEEWRPYTESPEFKHGNRLRDYQLEGLNWLVYNWYHHRNVMLADEMGLGKAVQSIAAMWHLFTVEKIRGPFLVIAPLATISQWKREFENWTDMNVLVYQGPAAARQVIRRYEWNNLDAEGRAISNLFKWNVLVTSYEMVIADSAHLKTIDWRYTVIDEAHRIKNKNSKLVMELQSYGFSDVLLLTATPLQNSIEELWSLLNLLDPQKFQSLEDFRNDFDDLGQMEQMQALHGLLRPLLLRRMKRDVEQSIDPTQGETILEVELTGIQEKYYKAIYEQHPYLINGAEAQILDGLTDPDSISRKLIESSGKLVLVDQLLPRLIAEGHKVVIFSQMVRMLDILEDYLNFRQFGYERIDSGVCENDRQGAVGRFCEKGSSEDRNVLLLHTPVSGMGINLPAADTVIIFDSDWGSHQSYVQAQARFAPTQAVKVYR